MADAEAPELDLYSCRIDVGMRGGMHITEHPGGGIVVLAASERPVAGSMHASFALVLVADLQALGLPNRGASATNAMDRIVSRFGVLSARFALPPRTLVWVELDSDGHFDMVYPTEGSCVFGPLRSVTGRVRARSIHAFEELFPVLGPALLSRLPQPTKPISTWAAGVDRAAWQERLQRGA